jgi:hypothetical protein
MAFDVAVKGAPGEPAVSAPGSKPDSRSSKSGQSGKPEGISWHHKAINKTLRDVCVGLWPVDAGELLYILKKSEAAKGNPFYYEWMAALYGAVMVAWCAAERINEKGADHSCYWADTLERTNKYVPVVFRCTRQPSSLKQYILC